MKPSYSFLKNRIETISGIYGLQKNEFLLLISFLFLEVISRLRNYLSDISFWNDEAALALNLAEKNYIDLFSPLDMGQIVPIGFCLIEKTALLFLGNSELSLRLVPFLAGTAALFFTLRFVNQAMGAMPAILCMAQLAVIKESIFYSNALKPYSLDLAIAIGLMLLAWQLVSREAYDRKQILLLGIAGALSVWFSFPCVFILAGISSLLLFSAYKHRNFKGLLISTLISILWLFSFVFHLQFLYEKTISNYLQSFWADYFLPLPPYTIQDLSFFYEDLPELFKNPLWTELPLLSFLLFIIGTILLWQKKRPLFILTIFPLILNIFASGLHKYPFGNRLLQYGVMNLYIPIVFLLLTFWSHARKGKLVRVIVILFIIANLGQPTVNAVKHIFFPKKYEQVKQVLTYVSKNHRPKDVFFVHYFANITFLYYKDSMGFKEESVILSKDVSSDLDSIPFDIQRLKKQASRLVNIRSCQTAQWG